MEKELISFGSGELATITKIKKNFHEIDIFEILSQFNKGLANTGFTGKLTLTSKNKIRLMITEGKQLLVGYEIEIYRSILYIDEVSYSQPNISSPNAVDKLIYQVEQFISHINYELSR